MARLYLETYTAPHANQGNSMNVNSLFQQDIISINDLSLAQIEAIIEVAGEIKRVQKQKTLDPALKSARDDRATPLDPALKSARDDRAGLALKNKIIAHCFFEPSTRTRLSFEAATLRQGGQVIGFSNQESLSIAKGETLSDTIQIVSQYADLIIIRHPREGAARLAADIANKPVINAGDGANQHPTQTLLDLMTIRESQERLAGLSIALVGDLKYGRTVHSLVQACKHLNTRLFLVSPESLCLPETLCNELKKESVRFSFHESIEEIIGKVDILYMTRIQRERFSEVEYERIKNQFILKKEMLTHAKHNLKILHPLPRVNEIEPSIDQTPYANYFQQAENGLYLRQALLAMVLNQDIRL